MTKKGKNVQISFLLIRKKSVLHVQIFFLLIRSLDLDAIFIAVPFKHYMIYFSLLISIINQS